MSTYRKVARSIAGSALAIIVLAFAVGWILGGGVLHPQKVPLRPDGYFYFMASLTIGLALWLARAYCLSRGIASL